MSFENYRRTFFRSISRNVIKAKKIPTWHKLGSFWLSIGNTVKKISLMSDNVSPEELGLLSGAKNPMAVHERAMPFNSCWGGGVARYTLRISRSRRQNFLLLCLLFCAVLCVCASHLLSLPTCSLLINISSGKRWNHHPSPEPSQDIYIICTCALQYTIQYSHSDISILGRPDSCKWRYATLITQPFTQMSQIPL